MSIHDDDDFFIDDNELNEEIPMTQVDDALIKFLDSMMKKIKEAKENILHAEKGEFKSTFLVINRYMSSIIDIINMIENQENGNTKLTDDEITDYLEQLELTAKELSFKDIKQYQEKQKEINLEKNPEDGQDNNTDDLGF